MRDGKFIIDQKIIYD